ncbi:Retrovirus-related Pol polyprotein from transposon RE2 [Vitis vinifera]|uniref:Retrovirus-related Pol polyprotein from transposon RE2 n=1 Tax=Vitis vinifera TaxID=29760 RepID=A0A438CVS0_VITVI|nr:Retrovirus-related Pol polyprotein from transposon RE2 [Vitis vinifera]
METDQATSITPTRLRGDNYDDWASDIQLALESRRKFEFLEGTITEQWKALAGLIGNAQVRMTALFECPVGLPNGESVVATQSGSVRLSNNITLKNDHTRELIGTGVRRDGLYYFDGAEGDSVQHVFCPQRSIHFGVVAQKDGTSFRESSEFFEDVFPFGNPGAVNIIPENIVLTVNVEIDSDFADFVDDDADLPNPQAQTQNPNLIQPEPQAHQDQVPHFDVDLDLGLREGGPAHTKASSAPLSLGRKLFHCWLDSLGLDNTSNGQSAPMGKGMRDKFPSVLLRDFVTHTVVAESPSPTTPSPQHPSAIISSNDPKSFKEAMKDVGWQKSMHEEIRALEENGTWTLEPLPKVVLGNHQEAGIDYHETFSPVAKMTTVRAFLAIATSKNWELHQMDVHNAFLHGDLEEEAPRCWFAKLVTTLKGYVFPRIEVARSSAGLFLCQRKYTLDIVSEVGLLGAKPCGFPIEQNHRLGLANGELLSNPESYRRLVGRLIYLAVTRPDLAYSVHVLSQFMQEPRIEHWEAALRVIRYLKVLRVRVSCYVQIVICPCRIGVILIGQHVQSLDALCPDGLCFLGNLLFLGRQRSNTQFPARLQKRNTELWQQLLVSSNG